MASLAGVWGISCVLLAVNSVMSLIAAATAGWAFNKSMDQATINIVFGGKSIFQKFSPTEEALSWSVMTGGHGLKSGELTPRKDRGMSIGRLTLSTMCYYCMS
jgi:hypothetical protein